MKNRGTIHWSHHLLAMAVVFAVVAAVEGVLSAILAVIVAWGISWLVWVLRYNATTLSWRHAADELDCELERHHVGVFDEGQPPIGAVANMLTPTPPVFELSGPIDGREVRVYIDAAASHTHTVWQMDATDVLPEWLSMRPASLDDRWLNVDDVKIGHEEFDDQVVVGGHTSDGTLKTFFWDTDLADELLELLDDVGPFEIDEGHLRLNISGIARRSRTIRVRVERLRTVAERLAFVLDDEPVDADFGETDEEAEKDAEAAVHVYD